MLQEPKEKKDKSDKDKSADKPKKEKSSKEAPAPAAAPSRPAPRAPPPPKAAPNKGSSNYLDGFDIPSSDEEDEGRERSARADLDDEGKPLSVAINARDNKKIADKERKAMEAAVRAKEDALREDENVFDVSYAGMGEEAAATATDIKVRHAWAG